MKKIILLLSIFACMSVLQAQKVADVYFYNSSNGYLFDTLPLSINVNLPAEGRFTLSQAGLSSFKVALVMENNRVSDIHAGDSILFLMSYNGKNMLTRSIILERNLEKDSSMWITFDEYVLIGGLTRIGSNDICYEIKKYNEIPVNDNGSCVVMKLDSKVSVEENVLSTAKVYPNPVRNTLSIDNVADANISIYSISGQLVKTIPAANGSIQVDMSTMAAGLYIVKMENGKQTRIEKIQVVK